MDSTFCTSCKQPKGAFACGVCQSLVCKKCVQILEENAFAFLDTVPAELTHRNYCTPCYNEKVHPELTSYRRTMGLARRVFVWHKANGEKTRRFKRTEKPIRVLECTDKDETLLRLAFVAAKADFNALLDVSLSSKKVRDHDGYQTLTWEGSAIPTLVDGEKVERDSKPGKILLDHP